MQKECDTTAIKSGDKTRGSSGHFKDDEIVYEIIYEIERDTQNKGQPERK